MEDRVAYAIISSLARNDRRLERLSDRDFRIWFRLICLAAEGDCPGEVEFTPLWLLAIETGLDNQDQAKDVIFRLDALGIVAAEWGVWQTNDDEEETVHLRFTHWRGGSFSMRGRIVELPAASEERDA